MTISMIGDVRNQHSIMEAFNEMLITESTDKASGLIQKWEAKYLKTATDIKVVKKELNIVRKLLSKEQDNVLLMDLITPAFLTINKQYKNNHDAQDDLADILGKI